MNIKKPMPSIRSYGTPSIFKGTNLWFVGENNYWYFNKEDDAHKGPLASGNFQQNLVASLYKGKDFFQKNLELLNSRINTVQKELSYWDLYKITHTVTSEQSFPSVISSLAVGESAVINCETFDYSNQRYRRGDVVVKISDSEEILVQAINTGVYKPQPIVGTLTPGTNTYQIKYKYEEAVPDGDIVSLKFPISDESSTYGNTYELDSDHMHKDFQTFFFSTEPIKPVIKSFIGDGVTYEEIILNEDLLITYATNVSPNKWNIDIASSVFKGIINKLYIQVK